jgi:hypothetical protein
MRIEFLVPTFYTLKNSNTNFIGSLTVNIWIPVYAILMLGIGTLWSTYIDLAIYFVTFMITYEIGYIFVDNIAYKWENKEIRNTIYHSPATGSEIILAILIRLLVISAIFLLFDHFSPAIVMVYCVSLGIFIIHGLLKETFRPATMIALRIIKGYAPYAFLVNLLSLQQRALILMVLIGTAIYHSIPYTTRKLSGTTRVDVGTIRNSWLRVVITLPLLIIAMLMFTVSLEDGVIMFITLILHHLFFVASRLVNDKRRELKKKAAQL